MKVFETFSGFGGWSFGLKKAGIDFEVVGISEIDKYAIQCYNQNHNRYNNKCSWKVPKGIKTKNFGDITTINPNELPDFDLLCASPPCQAFSVAGKCQGTNDEKGRGRLFENTINIMKVKQPKYAIYENVKGLTFKTHREYFNQILKLMEEAGYNVYHKVLNTKKYGVPQNRERIFFICIRKDIENKFEFPQEEELKIFLKDILENEVDEKYYLSEEQVNKLLSRSKLNKEKGLGFGAEFLPQDNICCTLISRDYKEPKIIQKIGDRDKNNWSIKDKYANCMSDRVQLLLEPNPIRLFGLYDGKTKHQAGSIYDINGISPILDTMQGGNRQPFIAASRGRNIENPSDRTPEKTEQRLEPRKDGVTNTISTIQKDNLVIHSLYPRSSKKNQGGTGHLTKEDNTSVANTIGSIRKLSPTECFRLQGFLDDEINLDGLSNTQKYKLAGNGLSINVVSKIFKELFK